MIKIVKTIFSLLFISHIAVGVALADLTIVSGETFVLNENETLTVDGALTIENGATIDASATNTSIVVSGDWNNSGTFIPGTDSTVTFTDDSATSTISGDNTFNNLTSETASKALIFEANSTQTITGTLTLDGQAQGTEIVLRSSISGTRWSLDASGGVQTVQFIDLKDSNVLSNNITANSSLNSGNNDDTETSPFWVFANSAYITSPQDGSEVGKQPVIIGYTTEANTAFTIEGTSGTATIVVASGTSDDAGNFRVQVDSDKLLDENTNTLRPYVGTNAGRMININVLAAPRASQVPTIDNLSDNDIITTNPFAVSGTAVPNTTVKLQILDSDNNIVLNCGSATSNASTGAYNLSCDAVAHSLAKGSNVITVTTYDGSDNPITTSSPITISFTDPFGIVFDSTSNNPIENATVTLYYDSDLGAGRNWIIAESGTHIGAGDTNPQTTGSDGFYSFNCIDGDFYFNITASGYDYPTDKNDADLPADKKIVTPGSRGEPFTVSGAVIEMDQPMDSSVTLLRVEKGANKKEAAVGDIVTYYVTIENLTAGDVTNVYLEDKIPAGFKYISGKAILDDHPISDPTGNRPITFNIGNLTQGETKTLKYQLVVGSGMSFGSYDNKAFAKYSDGTMISNNATETVIVIPDSDFDLGTAIGKVFNDRNENGVQDPPQTIDGKLIVEEPIPNVQIMTESGTVITTDKNGKYHLPRILPGRHLFRLDERTLPEGARLTTDKAVIVDITSSLMRKVNFGVKLPESEDTLNQNQGNLQVTQDRTIPKTRLNIGLFNPELIIKNNELKEKAEFRIFTNYHLFIKNWKLEISDTDTRRVVKTFEGTKDTIFEPIAWDGKIDSLTKGGRSALIRLDRNYSYRLVVTGMNGKKDMTKEKEIKIIDYKELKDETQEKDSETNNEDKETAYNKWLENENQIDNSAQKNIVILGETVRISGTNHQNVLIVKDGIVQTEITNVETPGFTAKDLIEGHQPEALNETEIILPYGEYDIHVTNTKGLTPRPERTEKTAESQDKTAETDGALIPSETNAYSKHLKIGDDYLYFVGLGDAQMGYNVNSGNIEPLQQDDSFKEGFYNEGKLAYYIKGKILGKYLITSSYDSQREQKELFKNLDEDKYYPVYGDTSSINYNDSDTQGNLYLLIEWDKSSVKWGNYNVGFNDTEFSKFSRTLYGGKVDYESLDSTRHGEAKTKAVIFRAQAQQKSAHNEFLATGGSLYYLKNKDIVEGSDKVTIEVRDKITGLIVSSKEMDERADYEIDYENGRIIFWKPVPMLVDSYSIISSELLEGNLVYVVVDYEYTVKENYDKATLGLRVRQAITDDVILGTTYVNEEKEDSHYILKGTDATIHLGKNATIVAEYAETESEAQGSFVSVDGGLSFNELPTSELSKGRAYGIKGDARLFNRLGLSSYYKWIDNDFSTSATSAQQGKELIGFGAAYDVSDNTRISIRHDMQRLVSDGNDQTERQVGAVKTATTLIQFIHKIRKLTLTGEYKRQEITEKDESSVLQKKVDEDILAVKADYKVNEKLKVSLQQQLSLQDKSNNQTTVGVTVKPTNKLTLKGEQSLGESGTATDLSATVNMNKNLSLTGGYAIAKDTNGESQSIASIGTDVVLNEKIKMHSALGVTKGADDIQTTSLVLGGSSVIDDDTKLNSEITLSDSAGNNSATYSLGGTSRLNDKTTTEGKISINDSSIDGRNTMLTLGSTTKLNEGLELASTKTFGKTLNSTSTEDKYSIIKTKGDKKMEGYFTKKHEEAQDSQSLTNIVGLSGDINDRWSAFANIEKGVVENYNGSESDRYAGSFGLGFVDKDMKTDEIKIKASSKLELRRDKGTEDTRQYLLYNAIEGRLNENTTIFAKANLSQTRNTTMKSTQAQYKELSIGVSYRPIKFDWINYITKYTYLEDNSPVAQSDINDIEAEKSHILSGEMILDLTEKLQLSEKLAYKKGEEKVTGFDFTETSSWLYINRLNYHVNDDWDISAEYRILNQKQARDQKHGALLEISRKIGDFIQVGVGYNFTSFNDDLTNLNYTSQGPFVRVTSKIFDRSKKEKQWKEMNAFDKKKELIIRKKIMQRLVSKNSRDAKKLKKLYLEANRLFEQDMLDEAEVMYKAVLLFIAKVEMDVRIKMDDRIKDEDDIHEIFSMANELYNQKKYKEAEAEYQSCLDLIEKIENGE